MQKTIIFEEKDTKRPHAQDPRIQIEETILRLVKTRGFKHVGMKQENYGYIWFTYVMSHHQTHDDRILDSLVDPAEEKDDYNKRREDFKKLMKNTDVSDDEISGPYDRDKNGKKIIGDVHEHYFREEEMGHKPFKQLCQAADHRDWLIEIQYQKEEDK